MKKISFLMAAHNEEKIIAKTLDSLVNLPYKNYEVIIGLDGCTDKTEQIIREFCKKSKKIKYYKLNLRQGKAVVINMIMKKASGDIIIINDADWIFTVKSKESMKEFIRVFEDPKIGGISESFPIEWDEGQIKKGNLGYKMVAYSTYFWYQFQKERFTKKEGRYLYPGVSTMFLTNIFKKKFYRENVSLGDDLERTYDIMKQGFKTLIFNDPDMPRMIANYDNILIRNIFKQKIRTAIARNQVKDEQNINITNYYLPVILYIFKESFKQDFKLGLLMSYWIFITSTATIVSRFIKMDTKEGWKLRART